MATLHTLSFNVVLFTLYRLTSPCVGGSKNVCLSDSEDTLSAVSDREVNNEVEGDKGQGETTRRKTRAATKRPQNEESLNTKRKSTRGSRDTQVVCDEFNSAPSSERRGRGASVKATQARKLLAKVCMFNECLF